jgi:hypothetical protein
MFYSRMGSPTLGESKDARSDEDVRKRTSMFATYIHPAADQ